MRAKQIYDYYFYNYITNDPSMRMSDAEEMALDVLYASDGGYTIHVLWGHLLD